MKLILPQFNNIRMALDYLQIYYRQASRHGARLGAEQAAAARELAAWERHLAEAWPGVRISLLTEPAVSVRAGEAIPIEAGVDLNGLAPQDLVMECVFGRLDRLGAFQPVCIGENGDCTLHLHTDGKTSKGLTRYLGDLAQADLQTRMSGLVHYQLRVFPQHRLLAHRFETGRMKWFRAGS
jgi:starch phosphorylase